MAPQNEGELLAMVREAMSLPGAARRDFVRSRCNGNDALRRRAEGLLMQEESATLVDGPLASEAPVRIEEAAAPTAPGLGKLGSYTLLSVLGEGGMGVVYLAEQERPRRVVALKVVRPGLITPTALRRFEHETEVLARLQHPGIAQIYEAGTASSPGAPGIAPAPFFAMEYIRGETLTAFAHDGQLSTGDRLRLFMQVCAAVQHAHAKGVIHRDLKPGNILVMKEGHAVLPKVLDFGIARLAEEGSVDAQRTEAGQVIGTIPYMSPEQIAGRVRDIDTRTDVYALGVVLFELLTGRRPHALDGKTLAEAARTIELGEPVRLGALDRSLRGDLETIVAKSLAHERERRYQSASELAADIERYLKDEPVLARPASRAYQIRKFARRNRDLVAGLAAAFLVLIAGVIGTSWMAYRATEQRERAESAQHEAEIERDNATSVLRYVDRMFSSIDPERAMGREVTVREVLDDTAGRLGEDFADKPRVEASIRGTLSNTYRALARYEEAEGHAREGWAKLRASLGDDDRETIDAQRRLAAVLTDRGEFDEAEKLLDDAGERLSRTLGPQHPEVGATIGELGRIYQSTGRMKEAEAAIRNCIAICRPALGDRELNVMIAMHNLATCLKDQGRFAEAEEAFREILRIRTAAYGERHPQTAYTMNNLAACLQRLGKNDEAVELLTKALEIRRSVLGPEHPSTIVTMTNLAGVKLGLGKLEEAEPLIVESVERSTRHLGETDARTMIAMNNLAYLQEELDRLEEAEAAYRRILEIKSRSANARDPETWGTMNNLAMLLQRQGDLDGADAMFREVMEVSKPLADSVPHLVAIFRNNHGECLTLMGRFDEAEKELTESLSVLEAKFGPGHARVAKGKARLDALHRAQRK
jgi:serine/threonine protein kinase/Tfp pilus assembly protein PilF